MFRQSVSDYFTDRKDPEAFSRLTKELEGWLPFSDESFELFQVWEMSKYVVLPFPGSWMDQPWWVKADFYLYMRFGHWCELNKNKPNVDGLPNIEDA